MIDAGMSDKMK